MLASKHSNKESSLETVKELIKAGANVNLQNNYCDTCLSYLIKHSNSLEIIKDVISRGASISHLTKNLENGTEEYKYNGNSLLHWCVIGIKENSSSYEILEYLETLNIDKSLKNQENKTYFDYLKNYKYCHVSSECHICYNKIGDKITILNCDCNCGKVCYNCSQIMIGNKCPYCRKIFTDVLVLKLVY
jgi:ankyrin repeat protein